MSQLCGCGQWLGLDTKYKRSLRAGWGHARQQIGSQEGTDSNKAQAILEVDNKNPIVAKSIFETPHLVDIESDISTISPTNCPEGSKFVEQTGKCENGSQKISADDFNLAMLNRLYNKTKTTTRTTTTTASPQANSTHRHRHSNSTGKYPKSTTTAATIPPASTDVTMMESTPKLVLDIGPEYQFPIVGQDSPGSGSESTEQTGDDSQEREGENAPNSTSGSGGVAFPGFKLSLVLLAILLCPLST